MIQHSKKYIEDEIKRAEILLDEIGPRERRLWDRLRISPELWDQDQYPDTGDFWVVAVIGQQCLYLNPFEGGWGWGRFENWGFVSEFHWQEEEIQHVMYFFLVGIDNGGTL